MLEVDIKLRITKCLTKLLSTCTLYMYVLFRSQNLEEKCSTVEGLLSLSDEKVKAMLENYADGQEESRRLIAALKHLQAYTGKGLL